MPPATKRDELEMSAVSVTPSTYLANARLLVS
jgi:hypothetical protein